MIHTITRAQWTKVASGANRGAVLPLETNGTYLQVIKPFGDAAPVDGVFTGGVPVPQNGALIKDSARIDVYITVRGVDAGSVRVDL